MNRPTNEELPQTGLNVDANQFQWFLMRSDKMNSQTKIFEYTDMKYIYRHIQFWSYSQAHLLATVVDLSGIGFICGNEMDIISNDMCKMFLHIHWSLFVRIFRVIFFFILYILFLLLFSFGVCRFQTQAQQWLNVVMPISYMHMYYSKCRKFECCYRVLCIVIFISVVFVVTCLIYVYTDSPL